MKKFFCLLPVLVLIAATSWVVARGWPGAKAKQSFTTTAAPLGQPGAAAGLRVHVDPVSGRVIPPPAQAAADPLAKEMFKSSHEGLVEEPGTTAAGGFKVDTRGRFQSAISVSLGPDGKPLLKHIDDNPAQPPAQ